MELKERYYRKLDEVLSTLLEASDPNDADRRIKEIAGEDWASIKEYLKVQGIASFASGSLWYVHQDALKRSKTEVQLILDNCSQDRKEKREDIFKQITIQVVSALIIAVVCFFAGIIWERCTSSHQPTKQKTEQTDNDVKLPLDDSQL